MTLGAAGLLLDSFWPTNADVSRHNVDYFVDPERVPQVSSLFSPIFCMLVLVFLACRTCIKEHCVCTERDGTVSLASIDLDSVEVRT